MNIKLLKEFYNLIESKQSEAQGLNILKRANIENPESIIKQFADGDKSNNQKNVPSMAFLYASGHANVNQIISILNEYNDLEIKQRVKPITLTKDAIKIGEKEFKDYIKFSEYTHGETQRHARPEQTGTSHEVFESEHKPMWSGNNIEIYEADSVGKAIAYTMGGLTGRSYRFCIGQPGNAEYKSYRDNQASTFYFISDRNRIKTNEDGTLNLDDPLHLVVYDATSRGVQLTDVNNSTGNIAEYGSNVDGYISYLKGKGVPVQKLVNRPKTEKEGEEERLLGKRNRDLSWFKKLPFEYKSAYIGRGHILSDEQFDYILGE